MPKYKPTEQDVWESKFCPVCGQEVFGEDETCDWRCAQQWQIFKDDFAQDMIDSMRLLEDE